MKLTKKIKWLFNSKLSDYKLGLLSGVSEQSINSIHSGRRSLLNMTLGNAEKLGTVYDKLSKKRSINK